MRDPKLQAIVDRAEKRAGDIIKKIIDDEFAEPPALRVARRLASLSVTEESLIRVRALGVLSEIASARFNAVCNKLRDLERESKKQAG